MFIVLEKWQGSQSLTGTKSLNKTNCAKSLDKNICANSLDKNTFANSLDKNTCANSVNKNTCANSVNKITCANSLNKNTCANSVNKNTCANSVTGTKIPVQIVWTKRHDSINTRVNGKHISQGEITNKAKGKGDCPLLNGYLLKGRSRITQYWA